MNYRVLLAAALATLLTACASGVKLDDVPVETRTPTATTTAPAGAGGTTGTAGPQTAVQPVNVGLGADDKAGPRDVARIIYFDYDSYVVKPEFQSAIEKHANFLRAEKSRKVVIEGHTDERGGREYNLALGQRRSEAVRRALGLLGVPDSQVEAVSFGKEKPAETGSNEAAWAKNRRAEIAYR
ncbi:peptidoglycan-associated lipoprotein Pal [Ramlibacter sp.]|uniref:peptidoglycan-associated lipoprotein Pal n=1 Tax=Ramlibacter sp. TaxID=1917967 RepID=UPI0035AED07A